MSWRSSRPGSFIGDCIIIWQQSGPGFSSMLQPGIIFLNSCFIRLSSHLKILECFNIIWLSTWIKSKTNWYQLQRAPSSPNFSTRGLGIENGRKPSAMLRNVLQCSEMYWNVGEGVLKYSRMFWCVLTCLTCYFNDIRYEMLHSTRSYNMIGSSFDHHCCVFQIFATLDGRKLAGSGTEFIWLIVM